MEGSFSSLFLQLITQSGDSLVTSTIVVSLARSSLIPFNRNKRASSSYVFYESPKKEGKNSM